MIVKTGLEPSIRHMTTVSWAVHGIHNTATRAAMLFPKRIALWCSAKCVASSCAPRLGDAGGRLCPNHAQKMVKRISKAKPHCAASYLRFSFVVI